MSSAAVSASRAGSFVAPAIRGLAAVGLTGIIVGVPAGLASRAIMKVGAFAAGPTLTGVHTSNGNRVGDFTVDGTFALVMFGGVMPVISAALLYLGVRPWLLGLGRWRGLALGAYGLALTGFSVLEPGNNDFVRFGPPALNIAMFAALFLGVGVAVAPVTDATLRVAADPSPGQRAILGLGLLPGAFITLGLAATAAAAWEARTRGEHFAGADASALLVLSVVIGLVAHGSRTARPLLLVALAALLLAGAWITGSAVRILLALAL